ncbi:hypothetical protein [Streptomyces ehimensis]|uniref:AAA+ ATPase domain-containing protein n=1 Tax=Streptomyces ehimensis TaxID=68195 RepID=A0ABV9BC92_9ACTN
MDFKHFVTRVTWHHGGGLFNARMGTAVNNEPAELPQRPGPRRKTTWRRGKQVHPDAPHSAWLWDALRHWGVHHGDPEHPWQLQTERIAEWLNCAKSTVTRWQLHGHLPKLAVFETVRREVGCGASCSSPYANLRELRVHYHSADAEQRDGKPPTPMGAHHTNAAHGAARQNKPPNTSNVERAVLAEHERTVRTWEMVRPRLDNPSLPDVHLRDLYVRRSVQKEVYQHLLNQRLNSRSPGVAVLGDPGFGKSCVLWGVQNDLNQKGYSTLAISASALLSSPESHAVLSPEDLRRGVQAYRRRLQSSHSGPPRLVLLLDTADLLLHDRDGATLLDSVIQGVRECGVAVAVACRSTEARLLEELGPKGTVAPLLKKFHLGGFDDGLGPFRGHRPRRGWAQNSELDHAVDSYIRAFCPDHVRSGAHPDATAAQTLSGPAMQMRATLADAMARGLPLGELIRHPLSFRMIFDLYAPAGPRDKDLDVAGLFREYWENRVVRDRRHNLVDGSPPATDPDAELDLSDAVCALGLAMLRAGKPDLPRADVMDILAKQCGSDLSNNVRRTLSVLLKRGVLRESSDHVLAFFHQAFAEHAAGRGLWRNGVSGLQAGANRVIKHPDDLFTAEAVRHGIHVADRDDAAGWYPALDSLMVDDHAAVRLTALRIHAGLRHSPSRAVDRGIKTLSTADSWQITSYLTVLTGTSRPAPHSWPKLLRTIWAGDSMADRRRVLVAVTHLAHQQPQEAAEFIEGIKLLSFLDADSLKCLPVGGELTMLLLGLDALSRDKTSAGCTRLIEAAVELGNKAVLEHSISALAHLTAEAPETYAPQAKLLPAKLAGLPPNRLWTNALDDLITAAAQPWAIAHGGTKLSELCEIAEQCALALTESTTTPKERVFLRGLANLLSSRPSQVVRRILNIAITSQSTGHPASAADAAKYLLAPLLAQDESTGAEAARKWCQSRLRPSSKAIFESGVAGTVAKALDTDKVPLPNTTIAACIGGDDRSAHPRPTSHKLWLAPPWPPALTAAAMAGGHPQATRAFEYHLTMSKPGIVGANTELREAIARRAVEVPEPLLDLLLKDARHSGDLQGLKRLSGLDEKLLAPLLSVSAQRATLLAIAQCLQESAGSKEVGLRLENQVADFPTVAETRERLTATTSSTLHRTIMRSTFERLTWEAEKWQGEDPLTALGPVLNEIRDSGQVVLSTGGPYDNYGRQTLLAANEAHLLLIALHAHYGDLTNEHLAELHKLVFATDLGAFLPPDDQEAHPYNWRRRFEHLPHLGLRLAKAGKEHAARQLLNTAITTMNHDDPSGRAGWRERAASNWRPYLRVISHTDRAALTDTIRSYAHQDIFMARHLIEVAGQTLGDISNEIYDLMRDPAIPESLAPVLRQTASWAGRAERGVAWPEIFQELADPDGA